MLEGVDPRAVTLASATAGAAAASRTLTDPNRARPVEHAGTDLIGEHFAHFRIERRIGQGGMGEVYLATDLALDRSVALKVLGREIIDDTTARDRFVREARSQARINHPNICHIYFIGEQFGRLFFAMELVEGENLQQRVDRTGGIPQREAIELVRMAAAGLAEAQKHGFTHRDVKPSNLLLDKHGVLKVADFGLVDTAADAMIVGTPRYMAPEQLRGEIVDFRADMYALGVTLHHLVAGAPPFAGRTMADLVAQHLGDTRPRFAGDSALLEALCDRLMAKRPIDRFPSYAELLAALEPLARG
ncbi:MAG: serine/threonine-protein kinase [Kofleriaceae bacterium]